MATRAMIILHKALGCLIPQRLTGSLIGAVISPESSKSCVAFDNLVAAAHQNGIKIIVDWANNHSNYNGGGESGALYNNGVFMASDSNDPNGYFHHNPNIADYNDRYQLQYYALAALEDLNQENATIDSYLKT